MNEFFSGHSITSPKYNHTVSAGSAKSASAQTRRGVMRSLLPAADEVEALDPEEADPNNMNDTEQFGGIMRCKHCGAEIIRIHAMGDPAVLKILERGWQAVFTVSS